MVEFFGFLGLDSNGLDGGNLDYELCFVYTIYLLMIFFGNKKMVNI